MPGVTVPRVAVRAASVKPVDWKLLTGAMSGGQPLDGTGYPGHDAADVVDEACEGVTKNSAGDEMFGRGQATQGTVQGCIAGWAMPG